MIQTERLKLIPETQELWSIKDHKGNTLGQLGYLHGMFSIELIEKAKNLGVATEAACAWLSLTTDKHITAVEPQDPKSVEFLEHIGFVHSDKQMHWRGKLPESQCSQLNQSLSINTDNISMPYHASATQLISCGTDVYDRPARLTPDATRAWHKMQHAAKEDDITLQLVSAYRSPKYQAGLIQKKLDNGQAIEDILCVNTPPGHSEHHTGRAIDLTTPGYDALEEHFEGSPAFAWLNNHANQFNFHLSYPRNNKHGIIYEPWHWCYQANKQHKT